MKIGILGGGQLSRLLALAGQPLGVEFVFLAPQRTRCVAGLGDFIEAQYTDQKAIIALQSQVDVVTIENEHIPPDTLAWIESQHACHPSSAVIACMQDRWEEKRLFQSLSIPTTTVCAIDSKAEAIKQLATYNYQAVIKQRCEGYDGKGQVVIRSQADIDQLSESQCKHAIIENLVAFDREVSIIAVRASSGECRFYDLNENLHKSGVLVQTRNCMNDPMQLLAEDYMTRILTQFNYVGVCALEFFQVGDTLVANELAPRVHNTGHWTIEGALTSQFENHCRAVLNLPLGETRSRFPVTMTNILDAMPSKESVLSQPGAHLHDYLKEPRPGRKLGHITYEGQH